MPRKPSPPTASPRRLAFAGPLDLRAAVVPTTINEEQRTFEIVLSTGAAVVRRPMFDDPFVERLEVSEEAVDLSRLNNGAPFVLDHGTEVASVVGVVERAWIHGRGAKAEVRASIRLSKRGELEGLWADVKAGILAHVSTRYSVSAWRIKEAGAEGALEERTATRWQPWEASLVAIGADDAAVVRTAGTTTEQYTATREPAAAADPTTTPTGDPNMDRTALIEQAARALGLEVADPFVRQLVEGEKDVEVATRELQAEAARRAAAQTRAAAQARTATAETAEEVRALERARIGSIRLAASACGIDPEDPFVRGLVGEGDSSGSQADVARVAIINEAARRQAADQPRTSPAQRAETRVQVVAEEFGKVRSGLGEAIGLRMGTVSAENLTDLGRDFRGMTCLEMARELLVARGADHREVRRLSRDALATRSLHDTTDFGNLLANVAGNRLLMEFAAQSRTFLPIARRNDAPDFREIKVTHLGGLSALEEVGEGGEFSSATVGERGETAVLRTYGKIVGFTRQSMINDDLGGLARVMRSSGRSTAALENNLVWLIVTSNGLMADGLALFSTGHANYVEGAGTTLTLANLGALHRDMARQRDLSPDGTELGEFINITPRYLVVPPDLSLTAAQLTTQITPADSSTPNPYAGRLQPIVEPRLGVASSTAWYGFADPAQADALEYGYLEGQTGPFVETRNGFEVDGVQMKIRHDFFAMAVAWQGAWKSKGAA